MSEEPREDRYADVETSHLENVEDGCGCTEIWEHTSDREPAAANTETDAESDAGAAEATEAEGSESTKADAAD